MEATVVYYERLGLHLYHLKKTVHVALPSKTKYYFNSLNIKSKTDAIDSKCLSQFACERKLSEWHPPKEIYSKLRALTRYLIQLKDQKTSITNRVHSKEHSYEIPKEVLKQECQIIKQLDKAIIVFQEQIRSLVSSDQELNLKMDKLCSIKGVGFFTVATIVSETLGFEQFHNKKQLTSYAGLDVVYRQSGSSTHGKTRISKKGNSYIRRSLYFPAIVSARYNTDLKKFYCRVIEKRGVKKKGLVAVSRKLLELMYTLWKTDQYFIENWEEKKTASVSEAALDDSLIASPS